MSALAVIPARLAATRLPRKPLQLLGGEPLIVRVWQRVQALGVADRVVVATDAREVAQAVTQAGGEAVMTRSDHPSGTDRVAEVASLDAFRDHDAVINVQGDEPFISRAVLHGVISALRTGDAPLATVAAHAPRDVLDRPDVVKVVTADDGRALYFSRAPIPWLRDPTDEAHLTPLVLQHVGVYGYSRSGLRRWVALPPHPLERVERLEQLRPLAAGLFMRVAIVDEPPEGGIDTPEDLVRANARWTEHHFAGRT